MKRCYASADGNRKAVATPLGGRPAVNFTVTICERAIDMRSLRSSSVSRPESGVEVTVEGLC